VYSLTNSTALHRTVGHIRTGSRAVPEPRFRVSSVRSLQFTSSSIRKASP
jgi:hypothetical protein